VGLPDANSSVFAYSGWNIDDIHSWAPASLFVSLPARPTEGNGVLAARRRVGAAALFADCDQSGVQQHRQGHRSPNVTILAGHTNASFDLTIVNNALLDGTQMAASPPRRRVTPRLEFHARL